MHLHVDPFCGAAGDMLLGALVDAGAPLSTLQETVDALGLGDVRLVVEPAHRGALVAQHLRVEVHEPQSYHRDPETIARLIEAAEIPGRVQTRAIAIFRKLGEAEAAVHGIPLEKVHFHEVGAVDSICDIVGVAAALEHFGVESVSSERWRVGSGETTSEHGVIPVPVPATVALARGFELERLPIRHELFTPTAAAILATLADPRPAPAMELVASGYGAGSRDHPERANVCRVLLGRRDGGGDAPYDTDEVNLLELNLDDQSPEEVAYALERVRAAGAVDAWATAAQFKKGRSGVVVSILVPEPERPAVEDVLFRETTTLGVRVLRVQRRILDREVVRVSVSPGEVEVKVGRDRDGRVLSVSPEHDSAASLARETGQTLKSIMLRARTAALRELEERHGEGR